VDSFPGVNMTEASLVDDIDRRRRWAPPDGCFVYWAGSNMNLLGELTQSAWQEVGGKSVLCLMSDHSFPPNGSSQLTNFYRSMRLAPHLHHEFQAFLHGQQWNEFQWICVHIRRTDLSVPANGSRPLISTILPLADYAARVQSFVDLAAHSTRIFLATDEPAAEEFMQLSFGADKVAILPKHAWGRSSHAALESAALDLALLAHCPILVGTYYSTYSATASKMGASYLSNVGPGPTDPVAP
ncbi:MAG: hypothetical protein EOO40_04165, partial [Deltaproteobacteria bacterium]